jgi:hypothetical protein
MYLLRLILSLLIEPIFHGCERPSEDFTVIWLDEILGCILSASQSA